MPLTNSFLCQAIGGLCLLYVPWLLVAIAMDRYVMVTRPLRARLDKKQAAIIISLIWALAGLCVFPRIFHASYKEHYLGKKFLNGSHGKYERLDHCGEVFSLSLQFSQKQKRYPTMCNCLQAWAYPQWRLAYGIFILVIRSFVPFFMIGGAHWAIARRLRIQGSRMLDSRASIRHASDDERKNRSDTTSCRGEI